MKMPNKIPYFCSCFGTCVFYSLVKTHMPVFSVSFLEKHEFCLATIQGCAFFGACSFGCAHFFILRRKQLWKNYFWSCSLSFCALVSSPLVTSRQSHPKAKNPTSIRIPTHGRITMLSIGMSAQVRTVPKKPIQPRMPQTQVVTVPHVAIYPKPILLCSPLKRLTVVMR